MSENNIDNLIERVHKDHLNKSESEDKQKSRVARWSDTLKETIRYFLLSHKKGVFISIISIILMGIVLYVLAIDYLTKRQNYPERNVLFRSTNVVYIAGGSEKKGEKSVDQLSETHVYEGGVESKVGTYLFMTTRELRDDIEYFNMDDSQKIRIASATRKPEIVQAGMRIGGSLNFKEQFAEIILSGESKAPQSYRVYKFVPERGLKEIEVTLIRHADGTTTMENRMTELRELGLGWLWGKDFRAGTFVEQYLIPRHQDGVWIRENQGNETLITEFQKNIKSLDSEETTNRRKRESVIKHVMELSEQIEARPIYLTYEDGFFDILPQESTIYLAYKPALSERIQDAVMGKSRHIRLRVENYFDMVPGSYPLLRHLHMGSGDNVVYPFDKYNNGGYIIKDKYGELAQIDIQDFILFYGQDVLYSYYLDLNGDGRLDKDAELIGSVLCRTTHDERIDLENLVGKGKPRRDVTFTIHYSFMGPASLVPKLELGSEREGIEYFNLCGYIESMMPDQINKGFGKDSMLGYINEQRSDIMLFKDLTVENMSRALTQESSLVAKYDIVKALIAAKRPYAQEIASSFGIADQFTGKYQKSPLLVEGRDWTVLILLILSVIFMGIYLMKRIILPDKNKKGKQP